MTVVRTVVDRVSDARFRRLLYLVVALIAAVLIFFPRPYLARAKIVPQDTSASAASTTALLGALGGGAQGIGSLLTGGRPSNDLYLIIGRSDSVKADVVETLKLVGPDAMFDTRREAILWLEKKVDVHLLLGGVMEIETKLFDPEKAEQITAAYAQAISRHLARYGRQIIINKQRIVSQRFQGALSRVAQAESNLNAFRRRNNLAEPEQQLSNALVQRATLQAQLQAKQIEYQTMSRLRGPESTELSSIASDISGLRGQIARTTSPSVGAAGPNVAGLSEISLRYLNLYRDLRFQMAMYDVYQRSAEQVAVEELASESASYIQTIDPAHVDPNRQFNVWAIALFAGVLLMALFTEWYAPATGLFRSASARRQTLVAEHV